MFARQLITVLCNFALLVACQSFLVPGCIQRPPRREVSCQLVTEQARTQSLKDESVVTRTVLRPRTYQNVGFFLTTKWARQREIGANLPGKSQTLLSQLNDQVSCSFAECMEATNGTELIAESAKMQTKTLKTKDGEKTNGKISPQLIEDALDAEGHTIGHWDEGSGSTRWALVEPDLAALKEEEREMENQRTKLQEKIMSSVPLYELAVEDKEEHLRERHQLAALRLKEALLRRTIAQYRPEEHSPECIAEGGQGTILVGKDLGTGERVAIKVERARPGDEESALQREFDVLYALQAAPGFPDILHYGRQTLNSKPQPTDCRVMVMNLMGPNLYDLWWNATQGARGLRSSTALALAYQMVGLVEQLHGQGFIHRDLKPHNFVMSGEGGRGRLCLIDFGLASAVEFERARARREAGASSMARPRFFGTTLYASADAHRGGPQSYRDDLEALIYVLAWLLNGWLPWADMCSGDKDKIGAMKRAALASIAAGQCDGSEASAASCALLRCQDQVCSTVIRELVSHCRSLHFDERPDYRLCKASLLRAYEAVTGRDSILEDKLEWLCPRPQEGRKPLDFLDLI